MQHDIALLHADVQLDEFQKAAIAALNAGKSVLVSAPTGAGKTLVADYCILRERQAGRGVIYTAPIKALSNQKYRDFKQLFGEKEVGIVTGDVAINDTAPILIMTTEIFRNMAIDRDSRLADFGFLIFDEVHYIDSDRGTAWEESIIFAPPHIKMLALSATVKNAAELADWMSSVRQEEVVLVEETRRPVPLDVLYFAGGHQLLTYEKAAEELENLFENREKEGPDHRQLAMTLRRQNLLPALYFVFSRRQCEEKALELAKIRSFLTADEKTAVRDRIQDAEQILGDSPGFRLLTRVLPKGIGFHHAGLLPRAKDLVEELYEQGLIKILYCTETFAVGVNYPVKCTAFDSTRKFDGVNFRSLSSQEFHQMAGRAGRRGIDTFGYAVVPVSPKETLVNWAETTVEPLNSRFQLSYNTILNLYTHHTEDEIEKILANSFLTYLSNRELRKLRREMEALTEERDKAFAVLCPFINTEQCAITREKRAEELREKQIALRLEKKRRHRKQKKIKALQAEIAELERRLASEARPCAAEIKANCRAAQPIYNRAASRLAELSALSRELDGFRQLKKELKRKRETLERLGYMCGDKVEPRGEVARQITIEEVCITELIFTGFFHDASPEEIVGILACLGYDGKPVTLPLPKDLSAVVKQAINICHAHALNFSKGLFSPGYAWASGVDFSELMAASGLPEGDLVSTMRRAMDILRQIRKAVAEDKALVEKLTECFRRVDREPVKVEL